jgi:AraC-like DNA-binding protein
MRVDGQYARSLNADLAQAPIAALATTVRRPLPPELADIIYMSRVGDAIPAHAFEWLGITLVLSPTVAVRESGGSGMIPPGSVLVIPAGEVIAFSTAGHATCRTKTLLIGRAHLDDRAAVTRHALVDDPQLRTELTSLFEELERPKYPVECRGRLDTIIERVVGHGTPVVLERSRHATPLVPVREYLRKHSTERWPVTSLERFSGLTRFHLARAFHREFGLPPRAYQRSLRLARACRLLTQGMRPSNVAYDCGFTDQSHLTRSFKKVYGVTPHAWAASVRVPARDGSLAAQQCQFADDGPPMAA